MDHIARPLEVKSVQETGEFTGYGSIFGNRDSYDDIVVKGAFSESLRQHGLDNTWPALLWQHAGDSPIGEWLEMREDDQGLRVKGRLWIDGDHPDQLALRAYRFLKSKGRAGLSIGFRTQKWRYDDEHSVRELETVELMEVSIVSFPANPAARVDSVKGISEVKTIRQLETLLRERAGFSRDSAKAIASHGVEAYLRDAGLDDATVNAIVAGGWPALAAAKSAVEEREVPEVDLSGLLSELRSVV